MNPVFAHIFDPRNIGDSVCCPADYFPEFRDMTRVNLWDDLEPYAFRDMIVGGGGVIHGDIETKLASFPDNGRKLIAWGIGHNQHFENKRGLVSDDYYSLKKFTLVGCRDWGVGFENYVPCVSCLHSEFNTPRPEPQFDYVVYEHHEHPIGINSPMKLNNNAGKGTFGIILDFLAMGRTVITNTYHGAYWAMLLDRPVLIWKPFSTRFHAFKYQPEFVDETNWAEKVAIKRDGLPINYLEECREYNLRFYEKVKEILA